MAFEVLRNSLWYKIVLKVCGSRWRQSPLKNWTKKRLSSFLVVSLVLSLLLSLILSLTHSVVLSVSISFLKCAFPGLFSYLFSSLLQTVNNKYWFNINCRWLNLNSFFLYHILALSLSPSNTWHLTHCVPLTHASLSPLFQNFASLTIAFTSLLSIILNGSARLFSIKLSSHFANESWNVLN